MNDDELQNYKIIKTEDEGNCAIHSVLYGLQRFYKNEEIVNILNKYLEQDEQIREVVLEEETPKIRYSTDTTNAVRKAMHNYYLDNYDNLTDDLKNNSRMNNNMPHYLNIINDRVWLIDTDLHHICIIFDICIKLHVHHNQSYHWRFITPSEEQTTNNIFEEQCKKVIYIQFVNGNHFQALMSNVSKGSVKKYNKTSKRRNSYNKTSKRRNSPLKRKYYNKTSKFQYNSNHTTQPKSNPIIFSGLALAGVAVGVLVAMNY